MKIGITGSKGFIGSNLKNKLKKHDVIEFDGNIKNINDLKKLYESSHKVVHLAGKNRGDEEDIFLTNTLGAYNIYECVNLYKKPTIIAGTTYSKVSAYFRSKNISDILIKELKSTKVLNYKIPNVIGAGCKPFYNSFVCTLCYLEAKKEPYLHLIKDLEETMIVIDVDLLTNDMVASLEDDLHAVYYKHFADGQRWFAEEETIKISFKEIVEIFQEKKDSKSKHKNLILKIVENYKNYVKV